MKAMKSKNTKNEVYRMLVEKRKSYSFSGLLNPSQIEGGRYDCDQVEAWAQWLGNLNAKIMLVGKDFGGTRFFREFRGGCNPERQTNKNLIQLFSSLGIDIGTPDRPNVSAPVFLTNAIFGLIDSPSKGGNPIKRRMLQENAKEFLRPLIDIVDPEIIIPMGEKAFLGVCLALDIERSHQKLRDALAISPLKSASGKLIFPVFHCGGLGLANRSFELQRSDWSRIKAYL
jgi:DNA polymerase